MCADVEFRVVAVNRTWQASRVADREMLDFIDYHRRPIQLDAALRVTVRDYGTGYIDGNVHTYRGRFGVWYPERQSGFATSLSEVEDMTEQARMWITGYLAGSEPPIAECLGIDADEDETEEEAQRWAAFCVRFRGTGNCPPLNRRPRRRLDITAEERAEIVIDPWQPKAIAGERVWVPQGDTWVEAEPQPELSSGQLTDTACSRRGHHNIMGIVSGWNVCLDCDEVTVNH